MSQTYRSLLAWDYRSMVRRPHQYGCQRFCRLEKHVNHLNQLWRIREGTITPIIFCRQCEYYTFSRKIGSCYCCGKPMAMAKARCSKSRRLNNKDKVRY